MNLYAGSDNLIEVNGLRDELSGSYWSDATVSASVLLDEIVIATVSLGYVTGSQGCYRGTLSDSTRLTSGSSYTIEIAASRGSNTVRLRKKALATNYGGRS